MAGPESAFVAMAGSNGAEHIPTLEGKMPGRSLRPLVSVSATPLHSDSAVSSISSRSTFTDEGVTSTGEHLRFRVKDFKSKIYNKSIVVERDFEPKEGVAIAPGLVIHKFLAGGFQGGIYEVADEEGNVRTDCLLKVLRKSAVLGDLEKEWAIGQALNVLSNKNGYLVGFMKTYEAIRVEGETGIRGMLIERLNGNLVEDVVSDHKFSDAVYLRDLLYQMFMALFKAETLLGFKHTDLRLTNIMEHYPDPDNPEVREFKIIDFGLSTIQERQGSKLQKRLQKAVFNKLTDPEALGKLFLRSINPATHVSALSEAIYRVAWLKHNDCYHVLASLSHFTDDRTWAEEDREIMEQYADLMKHVTGIQLRMKFMPRAELDAKKADKESEVTQLGYKVRNALADLKHFGQRVGSQASVLNHSDIAPQDALEHALFAEHPACGLGLPYHNRDSDDLVLFKDMELLRGRSRVLPEELHVHGLARGSESVVSDDGTNGQEEGEDEGASDDGAQQSWLSWKPVRSCRAAADAGGDANGASGISSNAAGAPGGAGNSMRRQHSCAFSCRMSVGLSGELQGLPPAATGSSVGGADATQAPVAATSAEDGVHANGGSAAHKSANVPARVPVNSVLPLSLQQRPAA